MRAKFKKPTLRERVTQWDKEHPGADAGAAAKALKLTKQQVWGVRTGYDKTPKEDSEPLSEKDLLAIARIGVDRAERAVRVLKALRRS